MNAIHDSSGEVVAWLDGERIRDLDGHVIAFLRRDNVYKLSGSHLGTFKAGYFRDHSGDAMAFIRGASGVPVLPFAAVPPIPPIPSTPPIQPIPSIPPIPAIPSLHWSSDGWDAFIFG